MANSSTHMAVGGYLDQLLAGNPTGNIALILEELQKMTAPSQFATAFESLNPGIYGANTDTTFAITRQYARTLQQRLAALRAIRWEEAAPQAASGRPFPLLAFNGSNASLGQVLGQGQGDSGGINDRLGCWIEGFGQWGSQGSLDRVSGYNYGGVGTGFGLDYAVTKNLILGANFGYSYTNLRMDNSVGNGKINSLYGSLYGTCFTERAYVEGVLSYGNHHYDNSRRVSIGALQASNQSSHKGNAFSVLTEAGYKFPLKQWNLQPFVSLNYCNLSEGRFEESGALATMQVDGRSTNSLVSELGTQVDRPIRTSKGTLVPMLKVGWQHDFGVSQNSVPFTLVGAPVGVTITQPRVSQDRAAIKAGLTFKAKGGVTSSIQYMGEVGEKTQNHGVIGQVRLAF
jgi:outer membrane autotransporter protein